LFANTDAVELSNQGGFQTFVFGGTSGALRFSADHPFLPQQARGVLAENDLDSFTLHRFNNDIIDPRDFREQFTWRFTTGLEGDFYLGDRNFNWETYVVHGETDAETRGEGIIDDRFLNAIDVRRLTASDLEEVSEEDILALSGTDSAGVGDVVCESVYQAALGNVTGTSGGGVTDEDLPFVDGCVPLNLFGQEARSEAARDWVTGTQITSSDIEQTVWNANFGGELFDLPAGPFQFNVGYERRKEEAVFQPALGNEVPLTRSSPFQRTGGEYNTDEYYAEFLAPIVDAGMDIPGVHLFELNGAAREIDNDLAGSATVWTGGGRYSPVPDVTFRGNYTESIRAPSLVELFAPVTKSFEFADDPCDFRFVDEGPNQEQREQNCRQELGPDYDPEEFTSDIVNATATGRTGGNPNLVNEKAESYSAGVTLEPRWVDNLVVTLDYVDIALEDAIQQLGLTRIMESCYDSPDFPNVDSCDRFERDEEGQVVDFLTGQANAATFDFEAVDLGVNYRFDVANTLGRMNEGWGEKNLGSFSVNARVHHLRERRISVVGEPNDPVIGGFNFPEYSGTFDFIWQLPDTRVFWRVNWQDDALLDPSGDDTFIDQNGNEVTSSGHRFISNASISHTLSNLFEGAPRDLTIQFTVDNVFDRDPDTVQQARGHFRFAEAFGRSYTLGLRGAW
jgi:outer membrane receptor protein involved in Fe transport